MKVRSALQRISSKINFPPIIDLGKSDVSIVLVGMGRSGTTWVGNVINYDNSYRVLFEPFLPAIVKEAKGFEYIQYLNPNCENASLQIQAKLILAGKIRNKWVDRDNRQLFYRRRMLKDIRCNLMIGWLKEVANDPPVVLVIRHPLQVASSWIKMKWDNDAFSFFNVIKSQELLSKDFPIISDVLKRIDQQDIIENMVFQWCVNLLVPSEHLKNNDAYALYYESLLTNFDDEVVKLFHYIDKPFKMIRLKNKMVRASSTNFQKRDFNQEKFSLLNSWKDEYSLKQIQRANYILEAFGLDDIYDNNGYPTGAQIFRS